MTKDMKSHIFRARKRLLDPDCGGMRAVKIVYHQGKSFIISEYHGSYELVRCRKDSLFFKLLNISSQPTIRKLMAELRKIDVNKLNLDI